MTADTKNSFPIVQFFAQFNYLLLNERKYSKESLLAIRNIVSTLFLAEGHYDIALMEAELLKLYEREADKQAVSLFLNWFRQLALYGKIAPEDYTLLQYLRQNLTTHYPIEWLYFSTGASQKLRSQNPDVIFSKKRGFLPKILVSVIPLK